jgi:hypothetical protein
MATVGDVLRRVSALDDAALDRLAKAVGTPQQEAAALLAQQEQARRAGAPAPAGTVDLSDDTGTRMLLTGAGAAVTLARDVEKARLFLSKQEDRRFTLGPMYVPDFMDAHGEWTDADELQAALWGWVRSGDRRIYLQHDRAVEAGEWVECMAWPWEVTVPMLNADGSVAGEATYPANTVFLGVVWTPPAWGLVRAGLLRGFSMGGLSDRVLADLPDGAMREGVSAKE